MKAIITILAAATMMFASCTNGQNNQSTKQSVDTTTKRTVDTTAIKAKIDSTKKK